MKKILLSLLFSILTVNLFAMPSYVGNTDEGKYAKKSDVIPAVEVEMELGLQWAYDFDTEQSGLKEIIDLDFKYFMNPFTIYKSNIDGIDYDAPYGVVEVAGGEVFFEIDDEIGDQTTHSVDVKINYELIYGKIVFDPFYLLVASSNKGNHYTRNNGWSFSRSTSGIRNDIAHLDYMVPWDGMNTGQWAITGGANTVSDVSSTSVFGLGYIFGTSEIIFQLASEYDWETNENNEYEYGFMLESNPVGNLTVKAQAHSGINYDVMPVDFAVGAGYRFDLTDSIAFIPFVGFDGMFIGDKEADDPFDAFNSETSIGAQLTWPGGTGWGYEPLNDKDTNRFSGIAAGLDIFNQDGKDPMFNVSISAFEETSGGLIPMLGTSLILEFSDITDYNGTDRDYIKTAFGLYLDYNIKDMVKPFVRAKKTSGKDDGAIDFESGIEYIAIPNTVITVGYDSDDLNDFENNKGLLYTEFKVVL